MNKLSEAQPPVNGDEIITENELCRRLSISPGTSKNWRDSGKLPFICLAGRSVRFHWKTVLQTLLRAQQGGQQ
jgi:predicted site-specific integrase-resolvase